jgi:BirA family biotin operon repressor/biotin-[acetyl-CoA-carboxylase] ligase
MPKDWIALALQGTAVSQYHYFDRIGSTNDEALKWVESGASDFSLVFADEQTSGRGRYDRHWITPPGASLAFSLILHPSPPDPSLIPFYSPLAAIAVHQAVTSLLGITAMIKWPNDVLIRRKKFCGILVEASWKGSSLAGIVMGIGINISLDSIPDKIHQNFPATCLEAECGHPVNRGDVLRATLQSIARWRSSLGSDALIEYWNQHLAFRNEWVRIEHSEKPSIIGKVKGIDPVGNLILDDKMENETRIMIGDVHTRPGIEEGGRENHAG